MPHSHRISFSHFVRNAHVRDRSCVINVYFVSSSTEMISSENLSCLRLGEFALLVIACVWFQIIERFIFELCAHKLNGMKAICDKIEQTKVSPRSQHCLWVRFLRKFRWKLKHKRQRLFCASLSPFRKWMKIRKPEINYWSKTTSFGPVVRKNVTYYSIFDARHTNLRPLLAYLPYHVLIASSI